MPERSQKDGQEDQGTLKALEEGVPLDLYFSFVLLAFLLALAWPPWNPIKLA